MDATWRTFGYQTYPSPFPSVTLIKPKTPTEVTIWCNEGKISDIYVYFQRPHCLRHLRICEFFTYYDYKYTLNDARFRINTNKYEEDGTLRFCRVEATANVKQFFIYKRLHPEHAITRLNGVHILYKIYFKRSCCFIL